MLSPVNSLELALIPAGAALAGVALQMAGSTWRDRVRERRVGERGQDRAVAELLAATVDLIGGIQTIRAAYDRSRWRDWLRRIARIWVAVSMSLAGETKFSRKVLLDWRKTAPLIGQLLEIDQSLSDRQRVIALDLSNVLSLRTNRFFAATATLTLGPDEKIVAAVRELSPAVTRLLDLLTASERKYTRARLHAEKALGRFRTVADGHKH
jgi:hypothetical protein